MVAIAQPDLLAPFTPEVSTGGWQIETDWSPMTGRVTFSFDPEYHETPDKENEVAIHAADANLIAAAPRLYRALAAFLDAIEQGSPAISEAYAYGKETIDDLIATFDA